MPFQVIRVNLAAYPGIVRRLSGHHSRAAQPVKALRVDVVWTAQDPSHHFEQRAIFDQRNQDTAQMIAKQSLVAVSLGLEYFIGDVLCCHLMESTPDKERLSTHQVAKPRKLFLVFQRAAITTVQIGNLIRLKILEG